MANIDIRVRGSEKIVKKLQTTKKRLTNYSKFFKEKVKPGLFDHFDELFEKDGSPRWRRLQSATLQQKRKEGSNTEILERKGRLRRSYTSDNSDNIIRISNNKLQFINRVPYAVYHEEGTDEIPSRPIVRQIIENKRFQRRIAKDLKEYILKDA